MYSKQKLTPGDVNRSEVENVGMSLRRAVRSARAELMAPRKRLRINGTESPTAPRTPPAPAGLRNDLGLSPRSPRSPSPAISSPEHPARYRERDADDFTPLQSSSPLGGADTPTPGGSPDFPSGDTPPSPIELPRSPTFPEEAPEEECPDQFPPSGAAVEEESDEEWGNPDDPASAPPKFAQLKEQERELLTKLEKKLSNRPTCAFLLALFPPIPSPIKK